MLGCCFRGPGIPSPPPPWGESPGDIRITKFEKLEYCYTIKIILYKFVIIFYKNLLKIESNFLTPIYLQANGLNLNCKLIVFDLKES